MTSQDVQQKIQDALDAARQHGAQADDPKCQALCETSAEVLKGLDTAFTHYHEKSEKAWQ